jgi:serine/threonine protein kinase
MKMMEKFESGQDKESSEALVSPELSESAQNELKLMKQISHENIVRYYDNFDEKCYKSEYLCIIFEYCKVFNYYI